MFLAPLKALLVTALTETFDSTYPIAEWQNLKVSIEYPIDRAAYPSVWCDFEPVDELSIVGIGSVFYTASHEVGSQMVANRYIGYRYQGEATFTIVALSSWERDRLFDELVKVFAFGQINASDSVFRQTIVNNEFIAANINFDNIKVRGMSQVPGTPWGSDEMVYEVTLGLDMIGEFYSNPSDNNLYLLREVLVTGTPEA